MDTVQAERRGLSIAIHAAQYAPAPSAGRLREEGLSQADRNFGVAIHLSPFAAILFTPAILTPLILWLIRKDESAFVDDHGREMLNALISFVLYHFVAAMTIIGLIALPVLWVVAVVNTIRAAVAAGRGEYFRYPLTIRFLS